MKPFELKISKNSESCSIISLTGYLDAHTAPELEKAIYELLSDGIFNIVVDFTALDYISSAGLGVFMVFIERIREKGGDIKLAAMTERVFSVFDLLGFPVLFNIYLTVQEAVDAFPRT